MKKVENVKVFNKLFTAHLSKDYETNSQNLIRNYKEIINKGLYYIEGENYLFFLEDRYSFYRLYYFLHRDIGAFEYPKLDKTTVYDYIYKGEAKKQILEDMNFKKIQSRHMYNLNLEDFNGEISNVIKKANISDLDDIYKLQEKYINRYTGNFLNRAEMKAAIKAGNVFFSNDLAYLRFTPKRNGLDLEALVVDETARGMGLGEKLCLSLIDEGKNRGLKNIDLWVDLENKAALKIYTDLNFKAKGLICDNYLGGEND